MRTPGVPKSAALAPPGTLTALVFPDGNLFTAYCPELDVATAGDTVEEARALLVDAVLVAAESLVEHRDDLGEPLLGQLPYAWLVYGRPESEIKMLLFPPQA